MKKSLQIGITGGIGTGKTLVSEIFHSLRIPVYDSDHAAKRLMSSDKELISQIKSALGNQSYTNENKPHREFIASLAFNSPEKIAALNALVHPRIAEDYAAWTRVQEGAPYIIKEAALLFETGSFKELDGIIVVAAPLSIRMKRILKRDPQRTEQDVLAIMRNQMDEEEKRRRADFIIENNESTMVIPQVLAIDKHLREKTTGQ